MDTIENVILTGLKKIPTPKGMVFHGLKASENSYKGFGEAYFSSVAPNEIKGWKRHSRMTLNLIVIVGEIEFTIYMTPALTARLRPYPKSQPFTGKLQQADTPTQCLVCL